MSRPKSASEEAFWVGARVRVTLSGSSVVGTVVEDRGPAADGNARLLRVQLDTVDVSEPLELEVRTAGVDRADMHVAERRKLEQIVSSATPRKRKILHAAFWAFNEPLRQVALGLWPDQLAQDVDRRWPAEPAFSVGEATAVLDELASTGAVVRRPTGIYISTDWLLKYLKETSFKAEWESPT